MNTLGYALLSLLAREPLSGYDLTQQMKTRVGFFWHARHSQIYPELAQLEEKGLVTHEVIEQQDRPDKKLYTITGEGLTALREWVIQDIPLPAIRDELVLKAYSLWLADAQQVIGLFRKHEQYHIEKLTHYEGIQQRMLRVWESSDKRVDAPEFASYATLMRGIGYEREYATWCSWVAETLEQHTRL